MRITTSILYGKSAWDRAQIALDIARKENPERQVRLVASFYEPDGDLNVVLAIIAEEDMSFVRWYHHAGHWQQHSNLLTIPVEAIHLESTP